MTPASGGVLGVAEGWQYTVPVAEQRRGMHIVAVVGTRIHSGMSWHRLGTGTAATLFEGRQGYHPDAIEAIERRFDMDNGTGVVVAWMDFVVPPLPLERQGFDCALPMPLRSAATAARTGEKA